MFNGKPRKCFSDNFTDDFICNAQWLLKIHPALIENARNDYLNEQQKKGDISWKLMFIKSTHLSDVVDFLTRSEKVMWL